MCNVSEQLIRIGRSFHSRGWVLGTSGNFSAVLSRDPIRLAITSSGADKGDLTSEQILEIDESCDSAPPARGRPSAESLLHVEIVTTLNAGAVLHTHSIWSTLLSDRHAERQGLAIEGYEMLKGLAGVTTHEHREWIPILDNDQDMARLAVRVREVLRSKPQPHAFLLRRHGMYTWGRTLQEAVRHVEIVEFLLEAAGRNEATPWHS